MIAIEITPITILIWNANIIISITFSNSKHRNCIDSFIEV